MSNAITMEELQKIGREARAKEATARYNELIDLLIKYRTKGFGYTSISQKLAKDGILNERTNNAYSAGYIKRCIKRAIKEGKFKEEQCACSDCQCACAKDKAYPDNEIEGTK